MESIEISGIHPTAIVHPEARLGSSVRIGPYAIIDPAVELGDDCWVGPHVYLTGNTVIGPENRFHAGCVIGDAPQDLKYRGGPTALRIGRNNIFREHVTVHRSNRPDEATVIGDGNYLMANSHVGHNVILGSKNTLANGSLLAGHVHVGDQAFVSGNCLVHQFCRIGRLSLMQGGSGISKDLPPFCVARGDNGICGLNTVGLRRAGIEAQLRQELRRAYHLIFRTNRRLQAAALEARETFPHNLLVAELADFVASTQRGLCADVGRWGGDRRTEPSIEVEG